MADNYIENKFEEYNSKKKVVYKSAGHSIDTLLKKNRSYRGYDPAYKVSKSVLEKIVAVNMLIPSAKNQQALRFKLVTEGNGDDIVLKHIKLGGMLPELHRRLRERSREPSSSYAPPCPKARCCMWMSASPRKVC